MTIYCLVLFYIRAIVRWLSVKISLYIYRADKSTIFGVHVPEVKTDDIRRGALVRILQGGRKMHKSKMAAIIKPMKLKA